MEQTHVSSVASICDAIGRRQIADEIGVRVTSVSNAVADDLFPARWFDVIERLCLARGIECPRHLFTFVGIDRDQQGGGSLKQPATSASSFEHPHENAS